MRPVLFRVDVNTRIGTGHAMRCFALAQAWQDAGGRAVFATGTCPPAFAARLEAERMDWISVTATPGSSDDAAQTAKQAQRANADWVIVDGYHFDAVYQKIVKRSDRRLLFFDDYGHANTYHADLVLNQNLHANASLYTEREPATRLLLGTRYALLRREFDAWRGWQRSTPVVARKILVTLGGSDPDNVTLKVLHALRAVAARDLEVMIVVGGSNPHLAELQNAARALPFAVRLESNVADMPTQMAWADVAIAAGGGTCWELAFLGLPSLVLALADNQRPVVQAVADAGIAIDAGWHAAVDAADIAVRLQPLLENVDARMAMARLGPLLVDGEGTSRVCAALAQTPVRLRPARPSDDHLLWQWANEATTRAMSFSAAPIPWEQHRAWFTRKLSDASCHFYIAVDEQDTPLGQVRFDVDENEAVISVSIDPAFRGRGYAAAMIANACRSLSHRDLVRRIHAYIKPENVASRRTFAKAGFAEIGTTTRPGCCAVHLVFEQEKGL